MSSPIEQVEFLDQIFYHDSGEDLDLLGNKGVGPIATSLSPSDLFDWNEQIEPLIHSANPKHPSLCYLPHGNMAVLIYRKTIDVKTKSGSFRSSSYADVLIGSTKVITTEYALHSWGWKWRDAIESESPVENKVLSTIKASDFTTAVDAERKDLSLEAREKPGFEQLVNRVFMKAENPAGFMVVIGDGDYDLPVRLLSGMIDRVDSEFVEGGFSTYEQTCDDSQTKLPRFVFVPKVLQTLHDNNRSQVDIPRARSFHDPDVEDENDGLIKTRRIEQEVRAGAGGTEGDVTGAGHFGGLPGTQLALGGEGHSESLIPATPAVPQAGDGRHGTGYEWRPSSQPQSPDMQPGAPGEMHPVPQGHAEPRSYPSSRPSNSGLPPENPTAVGIALIKTVITVRHHQISDLATTLNTWAGSQNDLSVIRDVRARLLAESFYSVYLNNLKSDANLAELDQLYDALVNCAFPRNVGALDAEDEILRLLANLSVPNQLAVKIRERIYPDGVAPTKLAGAIVERRKEDLGITDLADPGTSPPSDSSDQKHSISVVVTAPIVICVACLLVMALFLFGAAS